MLLGLAATLVVQSVEQRVRMAVDRGVGCVCQNTGIVGEQKDPCCGYGHREKRLRPERRVVRDVVAVSPCLPRMVFLAFGVEAVDKDNVEVGVVGRDELFDVFHPASSNEHGVCIYILRRLAQTTTWHFVV